MKRHYFIKHAVVVAMILLLCSACSTGKSPNPAVYTVTFDLNGGTTVEPIADISVKEGKSIGDEFPADPVRDPDTFMGWYPATDPGFSGGTWGTKYDKNTPIMQDITLKARWFAEVKGFSLEKDQLTLVMFGWEKLGLVLVPPDATIQDIEISSSAPAVVSVNQETGVITAVGFSNNTTFTGSAVITVTVDGKFTDSCTVNVSMTPQVLYSDLPPLKELFKDYFLMGNIFDPYRAASGSWPASGDIPPSDEPPVITTDMLLHDYNILTPQNNMKPSYLAPRRNDGVIEYSFATADRMVEAARTSGFKVVGHTMLWHGQNAGWMNEMRNETNREVALEVMREYITTVTSHFRGKLYAWDVLNEVFPDGVRATDNWKNVMRGTGSEPNPWYVAIGSDFVYEGFLAARQGDPEALLLYNDYNLDSAGKAQMVHDMVRDVNIRYAQEHPNANGRKLIEGIGMQSHHNIGLSAANVRATIELFRTLDVIISVTELDLLAQTWSDYDKPTPQERPPITPQGWLSQANLYGELFDIYLEHSDVIDRVTFWGKHDNNNWRSSAQPLLFDGQFKAKPAYYKAVGALERIKE